MGWDAESWVLRTRDGGLHWTKISDEYIQDMQFVNTKIGVGSEVDVISKRNLFAKTTDGGHTWKTSTLPGLRFVSKIRFTSPEVGWIAGTDDVSVLDERTEPVPLDLKQPFWMTKRITDTTKGHRLELREGH
jgi:photosystem II stability/assembly factor-like uncharacterized protein